MKRRGLLTKLALSIVAAPSIAKGVVDAKPIKNELPIPNGWAESVPYTPGQVVLDSEGRVYRVITTSNSPVDVTITSSYAEII